MAQRTTARAEKPERFRVDAASTLLCRAFWEAAECHRFQDPRSTTPLGTQIESLCSNHERARGGEVFWWGGLRCGRATGAADPRNDNDRWRGEFLQAQNNWHRGSSALWAEQALEITRLPR